MSEKQASEKFRIVGYVREFRPNILRTLNNLILLRVICTKCCKTAPLFKVLQGANGYNNTSFENEAQVPNCRDCGQKFTLYFNLQLIISGIYCRNTKVGVAGLFL